MMFVSLLLGFVPLLVYYVLAPFSVSVALWLCFAIAFSIGIRAFFETGVPRLLDGVGILLFGAFAIIDGFIAPDMSLARLSMILETGFFAATASSLVTRQPFTAQYAPPRAGTEDVAFLSRSNVILTAVWTAVFAATAATDAVASIVHIISPEWASGGRLAAFALALTFTWQFGIYIDRRLGDVPVLGRR